MIHYPEFNNIALEVGPIKIYWYGILYLLSFAAAWWLAKKRVQNLNYTGPTPNEIISDFIFYAALGIIIGGRLGYILFYSPSTLIHDPLSIFKIWQGGMSFHGGLIGTTVSLFFFARKKQIDFIRVLDFAAPLAPLGIALGRIGNFINSEVWGRVTTLPWGMLSEKGGPLPRHPSQLYEAVSEGIILFIIIWTYSKKPRPQGTVSGLFLCCYGILRFAGELFREPDEHLGFIAFNWLTVGQLLSLPMIIIGIIMILVCAGQKSRKRK